MLDHLAYRRHGFCVRLVPGHSYSGLGADLWRAKSREGSGSGQCRDRVAKKAHKGERGYDSIVIGSQ